MNLKLTAIPEDNMISVEGEVLFFAYPSPLGAVKAVQWDGRAGQLEYHDVAQNQAFGPEKFQDYVRPFLLLWQEEKSRWEAEADRPPTLQEARQARLMAVETRLAKIDLESIRPLRAVADGREIEADKEKLARLEQEAIVLREERAALAE